MKIDFARNIRLLLAVLLSPQCSLAASAPTGAVKLPPSQLFEADGFTCGQLKKNGPWISGRRIKGSFYSIAAERKNVLAQIRLTKKKQAKLKLTKKARELELLMTSRNLVCAGGPSKNNPTPVPSFPPTSEPPILNPSPEGTPINNPTPVPTSTPSPTPTAEPLVFNLSNANGLALGSLSASSFEVPQLAGFTSNASRSNMRKVNSSGNLEEVVTSGRAAISNFLIAPNEKVYVIFSDKTNLEDPSQKSSPNTCLLAEVDKLTGVPKCIDSDVSSIKWLDSRANKSIQFDATGAIFYLAIGPEGNTVLRKHDAGATNDLINDNISVEDFLVLQDGSVILYGRTNSSGQRWLRKKGVDGSLKTIRNINSCNNGVLFIRILPDNNIYIGIDDCSPGGIYRMSQNANTLEAQPWMGYSKIYNSQNQTMEDLPAPLAFDCAWPYTDSTLGPLLGTANGCGALAKYAHRTPDGKVFFIRYTNQLFRYFPTVSKPATIVDQISIARGVLGSIILSGLNSNGENILSLFNTTDNSEVELLGPEREIEIYRLNYVAAENKVMFDGLRFSDGKYVIGQVDLSTLGVITVQAGSKKLEDFQTF